MHIEERTDLYLTVEELADRWKMTAHALDQWRWKGHGPHFLSFGKRVLYNREEIERFEADTTQMTVVNINDPRFACIHLDKVRLGKTNLDMEKEDIPMGP